MLWHIHYLLSCWWKKQNPPNASCGSYRKKQGNLLPEAWHPPVPRLERLELHYTIRSHFPLSQAPWVLQAMTAAPWIPVLKSYIFLCAWKWVLYIFIKFPHSFRKTVKEKKGLEILITASHLEYHSLEKLYSLQIFTLPKIILFFHLCPTLFLTKQQKSLVMPHVSQTLSTTAHCPHPTYFSPALTGKPFAQRDTRSLVILLQTCVVIWAVRWTIPTGNLLLVFFPYFCFIIGKLLCWSKDSFDLFYYVSSIPLF